MSKKEEWNCWISPSASGWDNHIIMRKSEATIKFCTNFVNTTVIAGNRGEKKRARHTLLYKLSIIVGFMSNNFPNIRMSGQPVGAAGVGLGIPQRLEPSSAGPEPHPLSTLRSHMCVQITPSSPWEQRDPWKAHRELPALHTFLHTLAENTVGKHCAQTLLLLPGLSWADCFPRFAFVFKCNLLHNVRQCHHLKSLMRQPSTFKICHYLI